ncbi:MAG: class B sortase [Tenericutes bacterium]|nr:class B sortase [Mycoplasmatota bacterium]
MKKRKIMIKWGNLTILLIILICTAIFIISIVNILKWTIDNKKTDKQTEIITNIKVIEEVTDDENTEIIEQPITIDKNAPYWNFIKMNLIDADFNELKQINKEVRGWIQVNGTNINYPYVQASDNDFYLNHSFDKSSNGAGWIFMDYRNNPQEFDKNTIIYGHGRSNTSMFGTLKNILKSSWFKDSNNYVIKLATEQENSLWEVFSVYKIPTTSDYLQIKFSSDEEFQNFANKLIERSAYNFNTPVNSTDKIITLSTCWNNEEKVVMHAKLIKTQKKSN